MVEVRSLKSASLSPNQGGSRGAVVSLSFPASRSAFLCSQPLLKQTCVIFASEIKRGKVNEGQKEDNEDENGGTDVG